MIRPDTDDATEVAHPASSTTTNKRRRWTIRRLMITVGFIALLFRIYLVLGEMCHEPYARAFNGKYQRISDQAHLIGRPEADVIAVLGTPRRVHNHDARNGIPVRTFQYTHSSGCSGGFHVHCQKGVVRHMEQIDD